MYLNNYYLWRQKLNNNTKSKSKWINSFHKIDKINNKSYEDYELLIKDVSEAFRLIEKCENDYYYCLGKPLNEPSRIEQNSFFFEVRRDNIGNIIRAINLERSHDHHEIFIRVLKQIESAISELLYRTLKICPWSSTFPYIRKNGKREFIPRHIKTTNKF